MLTWWSRERVGDVAQQPRAVERDHLDAGPEHGRVALAPSQSTSIMRVACSLPQRHRVGAVGAVHADAAATGDEADDLVAGHRRAAVGEPHEHVVEALDVDADAVGPRCWWRRGREHGRRQLLVVVAAAEALGDLLGDAARRHVVLADRRQQRVEVGVAELGDHVLELRRRSTSAAPAGPRGGTRR